MSKVDAQSVIANAGRLLRKIKDHEEYEEVAQVANDELARAEDEAPAPKAGNDAAPSIRDASTALARLDGVALRAGTLAHVAQGMALTVAKYPGRKGEGPAYMAVAAKAMREETRAYETALNLADLLLRHPGSTTIEMLRNQSWVKDEEKEK